MKIILDKIEELNVDLSEDHLKYFVSFELRVTENQEKNVYVTDCMLEITLKAHFSMRKRMKPTSRGAARSMIGPTEYPIVFEFDNQADVSMVVDEFMIVSCIEGSNR